MMSQLEAYLLYCDYLGNKTPFPVILSNYLAYLYKSWHFRELDHILRRRYIIFNNKVVNLSMYHTKH